MFEISTVLIVWAVIAAVCMIIGAVITSFDEHMPLVGAFVGLVWGLGLGGTVAFWMAVLHFAAKFW